GDAAGRRPRRSPGAVLHPGDPGDVDAPPRIRDGRPMADVVLHPGRDRSVRRRHPWVLSGAVARVEGAPEPGAWVHVRSADGEPLGAGHWSPHSQIRVRLLAFGKDAAGVDAAAGDALVAERIARAV